MSTIPMRIWQITEKKSERVVANLVDSLKFAFLQGELSCDLKS